MLPPGATVDGLTVIEPSTMRNVAIALFEKPEMLINTNRLILKTFRINLFFSIF